MEPNFAAMAPSGGLAQSVEALPHTNHLALGISCILGFSLSVSAFALSKFMFLAFYFRQQWQKNKLLGPSKWL